MYLLTLKASESEKPTPGDTVFQRLVCRGWRGLAEDEASSCFSKDLPKLLPTSKIFDSHILSLLLLFQPAMSLY